MPGLFSAGSYKPDTVHCFLPSAEIPGLTWSQGLPHFLEKKKDTKGEMPSALRVLTAIHLEHKGSKETASLGGGILEDFKEEAISELGLKGWVGDPKQGRRVERGRQSSAVPHLAHPHTEPLRDTTHHPAPGIRQLRNRRSLRAPPPPAYIHGGGSLFTALLHFSVFTKMFLLPGSPPPRFSAWLAPSFSSPLYCRPPVPAPTASSLGLCAHLRFYWFHHHISLHQTVSARQRAGPPHTLPCVVHGRRQGACVLWLVGRMDKPLPADQVGLREPFMTNDLGLARRRSQMVERRGRKPEQGEKLRENPWRL